MNNNIKIFDTTLRDGEQSPGFSMSKEEKFEIAKILVDSKVDIIEAGFPIASSGDFDGVSLIARELGNQDTVICALARTIDKDILVAAKSIKDANHQRIHTFIGTTDDRLKIQYKIDKQQALKVIAKSIKMASGLVGEVEFSAEDATRTDLNFLIECYGVAIENGATIIDVADTVGVSDPWKFRDLICRLNKEFPNVIISTHCHNDIGLAVANTIGGMLGGARQLHVAINGIGERAGNASLEEVIVNIKDRYAEFNTNFDGRHIKPLSDILVKTTGVRVQPNKAITGENAFAHESGIHQDGFLKKRSIYESVNPEDYGFNSIDSLVIGKHSGRNALREKLAYYGIILSDLDIAKLMEEIEIWGNNNPRKRGLDNISLFQMTIQDSDRKIQGRYVFVNYTVRETNNTEKVEVFLKKNNKEISQKFEAKGEIEAGIHAIRDIAGKEYQMDNYEVFSKGKSESAGAVVSMDVFTDTGKIKAYAYGNNVIQTTFQCFVNGINQLENLTIMNV